MGVDSSFCKTFASQAPRVSCQNLWKKERARGREEKKKIKLVILACAVLIIPVLERQILMGSWPVRLVYLVISSERPCLKNRENKGDDAEGATSHGCPCYSHHMVLGKTWPTSLRLWF